MPSTVLSFLEILELKESFNRQKNNIDSRKALSEASLNRIMHHAGNGPFGIVTAWRKGLTTQQNIANMSELKSMLRSWNLGFIPMKGHWRECQDPNVSYENCPEDMFEDVVEPSLFVPNMSKDQAQTVRAKYNQDAVIYSGPETENQVVLLFKDDQMNIGSFNPNAIAQAYSTVKGRNFTFEAVANGQTEVWTESLFRRT